MGKCPVDLVRARAPGIAPVMALVMAPVMANVAPRAPVASSLWGVVVPGLIFGIAFAVTWALYRRFAGRKRGE